MSSPLRIAVVSLHTCPAALPGSPDAGGMNVVEMAQARALAARGHTVDLYTRRNGANAAQSTPLAPGITLHHLDAGPAEHVTKAAQEAYIDAFREVLREQPRPDLVHSQHWMSGVAALPVAREWGVPHVQSFHSVAALPGSPLDDGEPPESPGRVPGERLIAQGSDLVVAVSEAEKRTITDRCGADPARVIVIHPGVDHEVFRPLRTGEEPMSFGENGFLLFAGRLEQLKAADLAIRAHALLPRTGRPHLVVAGEAAPDFRDYEEELHALVGELGTAEEVTFLGAQPREELARMLRSALAVLVPSHSETFGLIALEAEASGTPVVANRSGGLVESVSDGVTGELVASRDVGDWADAISRVLAYRETLAAGATRFAEGFRWESAGSQLEAAYRSVLDHSVLNGDGPR